MTEFHENVRIELSSIEEELFTLLQASINFKGKQTIARVAGGWVRDKLLGKQSHDIDIALDDQNGEEFAAGVNEYLQANGHETRTVAIIQANPDQSKHLQTATLRVLGLDIDCVNLRSEKYADDSRIPEICCGTPYEDATRRDFTINSMFYNIATREIEDLTGNGINDLRLGLIRTPLPPLITFKDDPLRVLRAIRFSSRYSFQLHNEIEMAARDPFIKELFLTKLSRDRILKEVEGMTTRPAISIMLMFRLKIFDSVFLLPTYGTILDDDDDNYNNNDMNVGNNRIIEKIYLKWPNISIITVAWLNALIAIKSKNFDISKFDELNSILITDVELTTPIHANDPYYARTMYWTAAILELKDYKWYDKKKPISLSLALLREELRMDNETLRCVQMLIENTHLATEYSNTILFDRVNCGLFVRSCKHLWKGAILLAAATEISEKFLSINNTINNSSNIAGYKINSYDGPLLENFIVTKFEIDIIKKYVKLENDIELAGLSDAYMMKPLLDGKELIEVTGIKAGPLIGKVVDEQLKWQLNFPLGTKDECTHYLREFSSSLSSL